MRVVAVLVALGTICIGASGCESDSGLNTEKIIAATFIVEADGCGPRTRMGVGTSVGDGLVVTAAHVVAGTDLVELVDHRGEATSADIVLFDAALDVAAMRPVVVPTTSVTLRSERANQGESGVTALAAADGSITVIDVDVVQRVSILTTDIYRDDDVERPGLRVAAAIEPGDSGAMVHLAGGGVGIIWSRSTERADQAWTVDLPEQLTRSDSRLALVDPINTGPCP